MIHNYLIHSNEVQLIKREKIHKAAEQLVETLNLAAGSTEGFDIYKVIETYFLDVDKRHAINELLDIPQEPEYIELKMEEESAGQ